MSLARQTSKIESPRCDVKLGACQLARIRNRRAGTRSHRIPVGKFLSASQREKKIRRLIRRSVAFVRASRESATPFFS
jgi:hypothetical protein